MFGIGKWKRQAMATTRTLAAARLLNVRLEGDLEIAESAGDDWAKAAIDLGAKLSRAEAELARVQAKQDLECSDAQFEILASTTVRYDHKLAGRAATIRRLQQQICRYDAWAAALATTACEAVANQENRNASLRFRAQELEKAIQTLRSLLAAAFERNTKLEKQRDAYEYSLNTITREVQAHAKKKEAEAAPKASPALVQCDAWRSDRCRLGYGNCHAYKPHLWVGEAVCGTRQCGLYDRLVLCVPVEENDQ